MERTKVGGEKDERMRGKKEAEEEREERLRGKGEEEEQKKGENEK